MPDLVHHSRAIGSINGFVIHSHSDARNLQHAERHSGARQATRVGDARGSSRGAGTLSSLGIARSNSRLAQSLNKTCHARSFLHAREIVVLALAAGLGRSSSGRWVTYRHQQCSLRLLDLVPSYPSARSSPLTPPILNRCILFGGIFVCNTITNNPLEPWRCRTGLHLCLRS